MEPQAHNNNPTGRDRIFPLRPGGLPEIFLSFLVTAAVIGLVMFSAGNMQRKAMEEPRAACEAAIKTPGTVLKDGRSTFSGQEAEFSYTTPTSEFTGPAQSGTCIATHHKPTKTWTAELHPQPAPQ